MVFVTCFRITLALARSPSSHTYTSIRTISFRISAFCHCERSAAAAAAVTATVIWLSLDLSVVCI